MMTYSSIKEKSDRKIYILFFYHFFYMAEIIAVVYEIMN